MVRIVTFVRIANALEPDKGMRCDALVDTGASMMVLPKAWKDRFGKFVAERSVEMETATQSRVLGDVCGPVRIEVEGFDAIFNEVLFVDMQPVDGLYEPLVGYIVLEQCQAAVDLVGHRLLHAKAMDLK
jgi:predicted aspartyl protease